MARSTGYFATDRGIFHHWVARNPKRFKAWQWLIADAAFTPQGRRGSWGVVHVERGELATSLRILASKWGWPRSNVECFLRRLIRDGMITAYKTRTPTRTPNGSHLDHDITIITICNYDSFQKSSTRRKAKPGLQPGLQSGLQSDQPTLFVDELAPLRIQPLNQVESSLDESGLGGKEAKTSPRPRSIPRHGLRSKKHGTIFITKASDEWAVFAADFQEVRGAQPLPDKDGGFWFCYLGEAARSPHQRNWRTA